MAQQQLEDDSAYIVSGGAAVAEYQPADYQKLELKRYPARSLRETSEGKYWRRFKAPIVAKQVRRGLDGARSPRHALARWGGDAAQRDGTWRRHPPRGEAAACLSRC